MQPFEVHDEGVIKFRADHAESALSPRRFGALACTLVAWREILARTGLVGQAEGRYGGFGYGNVSARTGPPSAPRHRRAFLITGTQTSGRPCMSLDDFCLVETSDPARNAVTSRGVVMPSSESMTHGALYDLGSHLRFVFHAHSPVIWRRARALRLPTTDPSVPYGSRRMAAEVARLYRETALPESKVLAMGGHEDGIIAFGRTAEETGTALVALLARAYEQACAEDDGRFCSID